MESYQDMINQIQQVIGNALPVSTRTSMLYSEVASEDNKKTSEVCIFYLK